MARKAREANVAGGCVLPGFLVGANVGAATAHKRARRHGVMRSCDARRAPVTRRPPSLEPGQACAPSFQPSHVYRTVHTSINDEKMHSLRTTACTTPRTAARPQARCSPARRRRAHFQPSSNFQSPELTRPALRTMWLSEPAQLPLQMVGRQQVLGSVASVGCRHRCDIIYMRG
jgi:hypothetical protein